MLTLENITVTVGEAVLVEDVSASIAPGEVTAIVGPNGAGKTTLLRVASGELTPVRGTVTMDGRPLEHWTVDARARRRSVLPQTSSLNFPFPVLEVVLMGRTPHVNGVEKTRDWEIAWEALRAVSLEHLAERLYPTLSGGEQQRVHMARTLAQIWERPTEGHRYLLLDEPTNNLDLAHQHALLRLAHSMSRNETGVLVILHDLNLAARYADHIVVLSGGHLLARGAPEAVLTEDILEEAFEIPVLVTSHPEVSCPLIVARPDESVEIDTPRNL